MCLAALALPDCKPQSSWDNWTLSYPEIMAGKKKLVLNYPLPNKKERAEMQANANSLARRTKGKSLASKAMIIGNEVWNPFSAHNISSKKYQVRATTAAISGSGQYITNYNKIKQNAVMIPSFSNSDHTVISRREYLTDVKAGLGTPTVFTKQVYALNPAQSASFAWLASIAANYEQYDILGMVYEFKSTSGDSTGVNTALGSVIMATQYDPTKPDFQSKLEMEDYFFSSSCKPSQSMLHAVECKNSTAPTQGLLYTRSGSLTGTDLRWTDFGKFTIATIGMPNAGTVLGELWVSYKVKLIKPRLPVTIGFGGQLASKYFNRSGPSTVSPLGTATVTSSGPLDAIVTGTRISWIGIPKMNYIVLVYIAATSVSSCFSTTSGNVGGLNLFLNGTQSEFLAGTANGGTVTRTLECTAQNVNEYCFVDYVGTVSGTGTVSIFIFQMDETIA